MAGVCNSWRAGEKSRDVGQERNEDGQKRNREVRGREGGIIETDGHRSIGRDKSRQRIDS